MTVPTRRRAPAFPSAPGALVVPFGEAVNAFPGTRSVTGRGGATPAGPMQAPGRLRVHQAAVAQHRHEHSAHDTSPLAASTSSTRSPEKSTNIFSPAAIQLQIPGRNAHQGGLFPYRATASKAKGGGVALGQRAAAARRDQQLADGAILDPAPATSAGRLGRLGPTRGPH
ncbi:MAG: hypothetical protein M3083_22015 [Actinomycetota bacterium]|nr:hypothetical protein [Actinomycetota bacterium]